MNARTGLMINTSAKVLTLISYSQNEQNLKKTGLRSVSQWNVCCFLVKCVIVMGSGGCEGDTGLAGRCPHGSPADCCYMG